MPSTPIILIGTNILSKVGKKASEVITQDVGTKLGKRFKTELYLECETMNQVNMVLNMPVCAKCKTFSEATLSSVRKYHKNCTIKTKKS
jgi:hypothetical protein